VAGLTVPPAGPAGDAGPPTLVIERTRLAWRRTTLALTVVALVAIRAAITAIDPVSLLALAGVGAGWLAVLLVGHRRITQLSHGSTVGIRSGPAVLALVAVGYTLLGVLLTLR
jgi:uncharacterized membrane protein YidH (DUF202 family)